MITKTHTWATVFTLTVLTLIPIAPLRAQHFDILGEGHLGITTVRILPCLTNCSA